MVNRIIYSISKKSLQPYFVKANNRLSYTDFETRGGDRRWDFNNRQIFTKDNISFNENGEMSILAKKMTKDEILQNYDEYLFALERFKMPNVSGMWDYSSAELVLKQRLDMYSPGTIAINCKIPQGGIVPAMWIFDEWHESHKNDLFGRKGDVYFEVDGFESGPSRDQRKKCIFFSVHNGTSSKLKYFNNNILTGNFYSKNHWLQLEWDGLGGFLWRVNGVNVFEETLVLPDGLRPNLKLTLAVTQPLPHDVEWKINAIHYLKY